MEVFDWKGSGGRARRGRSAGFGRCGRWDQMGETPGFVCHGEGGCARLVGEAAGGKADEWTDGQQGQSFVGRWLAVPARRSMRRDFTRFPTHAAAPADGAWPYRDLVSLEVHVPFESSVVCHHASQIETVLLQIDEYRSHVLCHCVKCLAY